MILIYVLVVAWGSYDDKDFAVWYVSTSRKDAVEAVGTVDIDDVRWVYLETWGGGKKIKEEEMDLWQ